MRRRTFVATGLASIPLSGIAASGVPQHALVIGNDAYRFNTPLANAVNDARLMSTVLRELGADTQLLVNQTEAEMRQGVAAFSRKAEVAGGVAWVYYSGHGVQIDGKNYLQAVDADFSSVTAVRANGYDLEKIKRLLRLLGLQAVVLIVDACRNNPFSDTRGLQGLTKPDSTPGFFVAFSTAPYMQALDWKQAPNSPYTGSLAAALRARPSTIEEVFRQAANAVYKNTERKQSPWFESSLRDELILERASITVTKPKSGGDEIRNTTAVETRSVGIPTSYRPDVSINSDYAEFSAVMWQEAEARLLMVARRMDAGDAARAIRSANLPSAKDDELALAGLLLEDGKLVAKQADRAQMILRRAAMRGHVVAQTLLGELYYARRDYANAFRWIEEGARIGFPRAQMDLAQLQLEGQGTAADPAAAARLLMQSMQNLMKSQVR